MRRFQCALLAAVALIGFTSIASAADMAVKARPMAPAPAALTWTGCYIGGNVGGGWAGNSITDVIDNPNFNTGSDTATGVVGGGQVGCDYQFATNWVIGVQGMFNWANLNGSHLYSGTTDESLGTKTPWFGTLTGRIGYTVMPQTLLYIKGGAAWVKSNYSDIRPTYAGYASQTRGGWTLGGGVEYALQRNWSLFAEYAYIGLGSNNATLAYTGACGGFNCTYTYNEKNSVQTVLVGVNYRFNMH